MLKPLLRGCLLALPLLSPLALADADHPHVEIRTSQGNIELELDATAAPRTVENFLRYAGEDFYQGTVFHRVIDGFMIQGGGMTADMTRKKTHDPIALEESELKNTRGTIAMARTGQPDSATSQFFINLVDNQALDYRNLYEPGYTVFGHVVSGMDVVDAISGAPTGRRGPYADVPSDPITILDVERLD
ncbi:peptidylprolyl isomerase/peptidyl-prolyl cis-trans isomerase A (cyclophilin A) [Kushneria avicenniae]|uniref:Peptidyl-prolyl cis-trans isomerase n=1 Tax=Kushneria avicenniae TaxID=402385 RepID=A0A1I1JQ64_9GAMM|nr:peptidylprolyl isomerase [Kushneria avicenniae]SFC50535.1 peptidylprolyl isomerase/peptidyl-prolyl cis-trans isomerase A (cyclophilin A) [Kushneria avicenniae]